MRPFGTGTELCTIVRVSTVQLRETASGFGWRRRSLRCAGARRRRSGRRLGARRSLTSCACCRAKRGLVALRARSRLPVPDETGLAVSWPYPAFLGTLRKLPLPQGSGRAHRARIWTAARRTSLSPSLAPRVCCRAKRGLAAFGTHPASCARREPLNGGLAVPVDRTRVIRIARWTSIKRLAPLSSVSYGEAGADRELTVSHLHAAQWKDLDTMRETASGHAHFVVWK